MMTSLYTAFIKLNKTDKDYNKVILVVHPEEGVLIVQHTLFVLSFESFDKFKEEVDYNDLRHIGDVSL